MPGAVSRFAAVFNSEEATLVGPVRSARSYFVEYAKGLRGIYALVAISTESPDTLVAARLGALCAELEACARRGGDCLPTLTEMEHEFERLEVYLSERAEGSSAP